MIEIAILAAALLGPSPATTTRPARVIPTVYEAGHFYVVPQTVKDQKLRLIVDTGGGGGLGMYWITQSAAKRLGLKTRTCKTDKAFTITSVPDYRHGQGLPPPLENRSPCGETLVIGAKHYSDGDGQLGAGYLPGPVWFTERPDASFHQFMGQWMDKTPEGAVGGNVFCHFVMTVDYPDATAYFRCVHGCRAIETTVN